MAGPEADVTLTKMQPEVLPMDVTSVPNPRCHLLEPTSVPLGSPPSPPGRRDNDPSSMSKLECGPSRLSSSREGGEVSSASLQPPNTTGKNPGCSERESYLWKAFAHTLPKGGTDFSHANCCDNKSLENVPPPD